MTDRKKPGVAFWATVALAVVLAGYPLSFGPACWISSRWSGSDLAFQTTFRPLVWVVDHVWPNVWEILSPYASLAMPQDGIVFLPSDNPDYPRYIATNPTLILHFDPPTAGRAP
jgi:hypothetical protein